MARIVKCTIEMELIEGEHFNIAGTEPLPDDLAIDLAIGSFVDMINIIDNGGDLYDWVQAKIIEEEP